MEKISEEKCDFFSVVFRKTAEKLKKIFSDIRTCTIVCTIVINILIVPILFVMFSLTISAIAIVLLSEGFLIMITLNMITDI